VAATHPTRVAADLAESAARVGRLESRSAAQQIDHWARLGRNISMHQSAARRRIEGALAGDVPLADLSPDEHVVLAAELDVAIAEAAQSASFGAALAGEGVSTVALDAAGRLVRQHPDGTTSKVTKPGKTAKSTAAAPRTTHRRAGSA
jgi:hypothetical protein